MKSFLLTLLPNLRTLELESLYYTRPLEAFMREATENFTLSGTCGAFERLVSVNLTCLYDYRTIGRCSRNGFPLNFIHVVMAFPNIKKLTAHHTVEGKFPGIARYIKHRDLPPSRVMQLTLLEQDIQDVAFEELLKDAAPLESVHLTTRGGIRWFQYLPFFHEAKFGKLLLANAKFSFQKLVILCGRSNPLPHDHTQLQDFKILKDVTILTGYISARKRVYQLADTLPSSLERLEVDVEKQHRAFYDVIEVLEEKTERFPSLREVVIRAKPTRRQKYKINRLCRRNNVKCFHD
jgi:hypothetical protein